MIIHLKRCLSPPHWFLIRSLSPLSLWDISIFSSALKCPLPSSQQLSPSLTCLIFHWKIEVIRQELPRLITVEATGPPAFADIFLLLQREKRSSSWRWRVLPLRSYHFLSALWSSLLQSPDVSPALLGQLLLHLADPWDYSEALLSPVFKSNSPFTPQPIPVTSLSLSTVNLDNGCIRFETQLLHSNWSFFFCPWWSKRTCTYQAPSNCHVLKANDNTSETHLIPLIR